MNYQFDFSFLAEYWPELARGLWLTIRMSAITIVLGFFVGTIFAIGRSSQRKWLRRLSATYVEVIRNTPLLVQMFLIYFGLASLGLKLNANFCAILSIVINISAYTCEIMRAGIESIRKGQLEAARCLGLSPLQTLAVIVLPPATERVYPALTSQFILIMLTTSVVSQISAEELTSIATRIDSITFRSFEIYLVVAVLYILLAATVRACFWLIGRATFPRLRRLGTPL
ncbi:amino acid ABC transporter permease [Brucella thiophenivorans]|uniref:amino acid ABC transporter permease n=1 Tax=Brucella thiophenivorans TaxID=571255 RepID=UPI000B998562|nr:amino acid ABC transporter permease [Brucella thiophenivorans]